MNKPVRSFQKGTSGKSSNRQARQGFVPPRQVENHWNFYKKGVYIAKPGSGLPGWFLPLLALLLIIGLVFWAAPTAITRLQFLRQEAQGEEDGQVKLLYDQNTRVVSKPVADVFDRPDLKAARLTQALLNEPVSLLAVASPYGFLAIKLADGTEGYMMSRDLTEYRESIEPALYAYKLVIAAATKRVMSHASNGTLLAEVMMGTVLYADYRGDGLSRVRLPDGSSGWISDEGVIILPADGQISQPADASRYFCSTALTFRQVTVLENGQSVRGISTTGIARLAAAINGAVLPRTLDGIAESGAAVQLSFSEDTGLADLGLLQPGDLVLLGATGDSEQPGDLAIYVDTNQVLFARPSHASIQLIDLTQNVDLWQRIIAVRRIFS